MKETEYVKVPKKDQLDYDEDGSDDTNAITEETGADDEDLDDYRDRTGPVWSPE
jgi:hypothetical protein